MNSPQQIIKRLTFRSHSIRRMLVILSVITLVVGLQSYLHYSKLGPMMLQANEQFIYLADEMQSIKLTENITDSIVELRTLSEDTAWRSDLDEIQSNFQGFTNAPGEGMGVLLSQVITFNNKASTGKELIAQLHTDLIKLDAWYLDYYGDIIATITSPGILYWPTSMLLKWHYGKELLDTMQFNRGLYLIIIGEVSAGQAILGELRTRLPDSSLRARVMFTQGRLLYGVGRYEQSVEVVQESVKMDPSLSLAKKFLEYQLSKGPDEEMEEEEEDVQRVGTASSGGSTLF
jgi:hypothetical protein